MSEAAYVLLGTALTVLATAALTVWRSRRSSPESQATLIGGADLLLSQLQKRVAALEAEQVKMRKALENERQRADEYRHLARRLESMSNEHYPMRQFVDDGWLHTLNHEVAVPHYGVIVGVYLDDIDGHVALHYDVLPIEKATAEMRRTFSIDHILKMRLSDVARARRVELGYPAEPPNGHSK